MEISASFRSLDALCQMSNIEFNICAEINKGEEGHFNGKTSGLKEHHQAVELHHTRVSPVNPDKGRITRTGIATKSSENFF